MTSVHTHTPTQYPGAFRTDIAVDDATPGPFDARPEVGRTVHLDGWVNTYNVYQVLQLLAVGDAVETGHSTTASNLISLAFRDELCQHLHVQAFAGEVRVQRIS